MTGPDGIRRQLEDGIERAIDLLDQLDDDAEREAEDDTDDEGEARNQPAAMYGTG